MGGLQDFQRCCENIAKNIEKQGKAARGRVQGRMVNVEGKLYPFAVAVPVRVTDGSYVWVHIADNKAVVIGA